MASNWQLLIGGVDYSRYCDFPSIDIWGSNRHRGSQASLKVTIPGKALARPKGFAQVQIKNLSNATYLFGGVIGRVDQAETGQPGTVDYTLSCVDYTRWLDHIPAGASVYGPATGQAYISDIVKQVVTDWAITTTQYTTLGTNPPSVPLTLTGVQQVPIVYYGYNPNYLPLSQVLDQLAQFAEAIWYVDYAANLVFANPDSSFLNAPLATQAITYYDQGQQKLVTATLPTLSADSDLTTYRDLTLSEDVSTTISGVLMKDYLESSTVQTTDSPTTNNTKLTGDGITRFFPLTNPPTDVNHATVTKNHGGTITTYNVANNNLRTEYVDGNPASPGAQDYCFLCSTNQGIRFNLAPANGDQITVAYNYYQSGFFPYTQPNLAAIIAAREGFGPGYYYEVLSDPDLSSPMTLADGTPPWEAAAEIRINRYGRIKILAKFDSYVGGWYPGQIFAITSALRGDNANNADTQFTGWGTTFTQKFYVTQTETKIVDDTTVTTTVEACSDIFGE